MFPCEGQQVTLSCGAVCLLMDPVAPGECLALFKLNTVKVSKWMETVCDVGVRRAHGFKGGAGGRHMKDAPQQSHWVLWADVALTTAQWGMTRKQTNR